MKKDSIDMDWRADADLNTLIEAEKIKRDKKRLSAAMKRKRELLRDLGRLSEGKK